MQKIERGEKKMENKMYSYGAIGACGLGAFLMIIDQSFIGLLGGIIAGFGAIFSVLLMKYGYIIMPLITKQSSITSYTDGAYEIPPGQDVIVKKIGEEYYASCFLGMKIYESSTEKSIDQNMMYNEYFERAISNMKYVTKISYLLYVEDISKKRKNLETKKAEAQLRLGREREKTEPDVLKIERYEREIVALNHEVDKMIRGEKPMGIIASCMTSSKGVSREAAIAEAKAQARELKTLLSNALNVEVEQLTADEMLKCFEWERFFPSSGHEIENRMV